MSWKRLAVRGGWQKRRQLESAYRQTVRQRLVVSLHRLCVRDRMQVIANPHRPVGAGAAMEMQRIVGNPVKKGPKQPDTEQEGHE